MAFSINSSPWILRKPLGFSHNDSRMHLFCPSSYNRISFPKKFHLNCCLSPETSNPEARFTPLIVKKGEPIFLKIVADCRDESVETDQNNAVTITSDDVCNVVSVNSDENGSKAAGKVGFFTYIGNLDLLEKHVQDAQSKLQKPKIEWSKIFVGTAGIVLNNPYVKLYLETARPVITWYYYEILGELVKLLKTNPLLRIAAPKMMTVDVEAHEVVPEGEAEEGEEVEAREVVPEGEAEEGEADGV